MNVALIFAGAMGNIIDSTFYGVVYQQGSLFHGRVVDMFYFPLLSGNFPSWVPFWGGEDFVFFRPVFNVADSAISIGVIMILLFQKRYFKHEVAEVSHPNSEIVEE
jgi:signal peptidase II